MLSKEEVLEIISYCDTHGVQRKVRLRELGMTEWNFYKSRRQYLRQEKVNPAAVGLHGRRLVREIGGKPQYTL